MLDTAGHAPPSSPTWVKNPSEIDSRSAAELGDQLVEALVRLAHPVLHARAEVGIAILDRLVYDSAPHDRLVALRLEFDGLDALGVGKHLESPGLRHLVRAIDQHVLAAERRLVAVGCL